MLAGAVCGLTSWGPVSGWIGAYQTDQLAPLTDGAWHLMLNISDNSLIWWRADGLITRLLPFTAAPTVLPALASLLFFVIGACQLFLIAGREHGLHTVDAVLASVSLGALMLLLLGADCVVFGALAWMPWLAVCGYLIHRQARGLRRCVILALYFFIAWRLGMSAGTLACPLAALALLLSRALTEQDDDTLPRGISSLLIPLVALAVTAVPLLQAPSLPHYDYPFLSRVVTDDGIAGMIRPLVGESAPLPLIDRTVARAQTEPVALALLAVTLSALLLIRTLRAARVFIGISLFGTLSLFWDTCLPESFAHIGPLQSLVRVLPGYSTLSPLPLLCALSLIGIFGMLLATNRVLILATLQGFLLCITFVSPLASGLLVDPQGAITTRQILKLPGVQLTPEFLQRAFSPSFGLLKREGLGILTRPELFSELTPVSPARFRVTLSTSHRSHSNAPLRMLDGKSATRWSSQTASQQGDEWIEMRFLEPVDIQGIELDPGPYHADFPRGLRMVRCDSADGIPGSSTFYDAPSWEGAIYRTPAGFPYYGAQSAVRIVFRREVRTSCVRIEQTGRSAQFEWSVSEISLLVKTAPPDAV